MTTHVIKLLFMPFFLTVSASQQPAQLESLQKNILERRHKVVFNPDNKHKSTFSGRITRGDQFTVLQTPTTGDHVSVDLTEQNALHPAIIPNPIIYTHTLIQEFLNNTPTKNGYFSQEKNFFDQKDPETVFTCLGFIQKAYLQHLIQQQTHLAPLAQSTTTITDENVYSQLVQDLIEYAQSHDSAQKKSVIRNALGTLAGIGLTAAAASLAAHLKA